METDSIIKNSKESRKESRNESTIVTETSAYEEFYEADEDAFSARFVNEIEIIKQDFNEQDKEKLEISDLSSEMNELSMDNEKININKESKKEINKDNKQSRELKAADLMKSSKQLKKN